MILCGDKPNNTREASSVVVAPTQSVFRPIGIEQCQITGGDWGRLQKLNSDVTIRHCLKWEERMGWLNNFSLVAQGCENDQYQGREFADSDVYKLLEAMAWEIGRSKDCELEKIFARLVEPIAAAQQPDGYINTKFDNPGQKKRYSDFEWGHELYCFGHLFQAAVARLRIGKPFSDPLVRVALKAADHVCSTFADGRLEKIGGHPVIEMGLTELGRATGREEYIEQARIFVERRGHQLLDGSLFGSAYFSDDVPVRDADVFRGHAVRALYLASGAVDVASETGDSVLLDKVQQQYRRTLERRTYVTGGMGSHHEDESFGDDWELPADRSYCESCAGIASVMLAWRLLLETGDMQYGDVIERTLYNMLRTSIAADGKSFFYANTLHRRTLSEQTSQEEASLRAASKMRAPWFEVSCCPTNISRTIASLSDLIATHTADALQIHQFIESDINVKLDSGMLRLHIATDYPYSGEIEIEILEAPESPVSVEIRIPAWANNPDGSGVAKFEGKVVPSGQSSVRVTKCFEAGERLKLSLPMKIRCVYPNPRIDAVRGCLAVELGPLVLCAESVDLPDGVCLDDVVVTPSAAKQNLNEIHGEIAAKVQKVATHKPYFSCTNPYLPRYIPESEFQMKLIPYFQWGNRGPSTMRVWLPYEY